MLPPSSLPSKTLFRGRRTRETHRYGACARGYSIQLSPRCWLLRCTVPPYPIHPYHANEHSTFATSVTVPAIPLLQEAFHVSRVEAILPLTLYTLGIAFGPLFIAPLSETLGRRWVYIGTCTCFLAFTVGAGASDTFTSLLLCRFFAAFLGSAGLAMGGGSVADIWHLEKAGGSAALFFILGPFLGMLMHMSS